jgi:hypothetical protein
MSTTDTCTLLFFQLLNWPCYREVRAVLAISYIQDSISIVIGQALPSLYMVPLLRTVRFLRLLEPKSIIHVLVISALNLVVLIIKI